MLARELNCITSLLVLVLCGAYVGSSPVSKRYLSCEGETAHLYCVQGYIKVIRANYGRTDTWTCSDHRPSNQVSNKYCHHHGSLSIVSNRCDGLQECSVPAVNHVFSDPCVGTYKYLEVSYLCVPQQRSVICEYQKGTISCDNGVIFVHHANYGRRDLRTCKHQLATSSDCYSSQTYRLRAICNGKKSCYLHASNSVFSDPCYGVFKYLEVTYSCSL